MTLSSSQLLECLQQKHDDFKHFSSSALETYKLYRNSLRTVSQLSSKQIKQRLLPKVALGARPLKPLGKSLNWHLPCNLKWGNQEQSLSWAKSQLTDVTTFAVDGSQIFPNADLSIPVALVQIGWFANPHNSARGYEKNVKLAILSPRDLQQEMPDVPVERQVNMRRFSLEIQRIIEFMESHNPNDDCLVFFDGSLIATFAETFDHGCRAFYVECLLKLLRVCEQTRVPMVAYIDNSNARDLVTLIQSLESLPDAPTLTDASLIGLGMKWGDRCPLFQCDRGKGIGREGVLHSYQEQADQIVFTYLKTCDRKPVRLEMPRWIVEDGIHEQVLNYVRAEVIVGRGYPYAIETADQVAVIQGHDRQQFYRLFQNWAQTEDIPLSFSRKLVSKMMRR